MPITKEEYEAAKAIIDQYHRQQFPPIPKSRCCGRCGGEDECVADMICETHKTMGCEICYGPRDPAEYAKWCEKK